MTGNGKILMMDVCLEQLKSPESLSVISAFERERYERSRSSYEGLERIYPGIARVESCILAPYHALFSAKELEILVAIAEDLDERAGDELPFILEQQRLAEIVRKESPSILAFYDELAFHALARGAMRGISGSAYINSQGCADSIYAMIMPRRKDAESLEERKRRVIVSDIAATLTILASAEPCREAGVPRLVEPLSGEGIELLLATYQRGVRSDLDRIYQSP